MLAASDEEVKERCMETYREEKKKGKKFNVSEQKKVNGQFGTQMNEDVGIGNCFGRR